MQRLCLLVAIRRVEFVDGRKFAAVAPDESLLSDNASESFKNTCLGPIGHQVSASELAAAAVDQEEKYLGIRTGYCLEGLAPMQRLYPLPRRLGLDNFIAGGKLC